MMAALVNIASQSWSPLSSAQSSGVEAKARIVAEISGKTWVLDRYPYSGYESGRFFLDGSVQLPERLATNSTALIDSLAKGEFKVVEPNQRGQFIKELTRYSELQLFCSQIPVRYWNGAGEMSQGDLEKRKKRNSPDITPYFPGLPRPIDYEFQFKGSLEPYARATANFEFYELGEDNSGDKLLVLRAEDYEPLAGREPSGRTLEGTFAAFKMPSCRFIGTVDYFTHCFDPHGSPPWQPDKNSLAQVISIKGRPFAITIAYATCEGTEGVRSEGTLRLWDLAAEEHLPVVFGFSSLPKYGKMGSEYESLTARPAAPITAGSSTCR
jgi:hypothetical protein